MKKYVLDMDVSLETLEFDSEMEVTGHYELDEFLRGGLEDEDVKMTVLEEERVKMDISVEDWEKDVINVDFDEWLVLEISKM